MIDHMREFKAIALEVEPDEVNLFIGLAQPADNLGIDDLDRHGFQTLGQDGAMHCIGRVGVGLDDDESFDPAREPREEHLCRAQQRRIKNQYSSSLPAAEPGAVKFGSDEIVGLYFHWRDFLFGEPQAFRTAVLHLGQKMRVSKYLGR